MRFLSRVSCSNVSRGPTSPWTRRNESWLDTVLPQGPSVTCGCVPVRIGAQGHKTATIRCFPQRSGVAGSPRCRSVRCRQRHLHLRGRHLHQLGAPRRAELPRSCSGSTIRLCPIVHYQLAESTFPYSVACRGHCPQTRHLLPVSPSPISDLPK